MAKITFTCEKCGKEIIIETDVMSEEKAKKLHECKKEKDGKKHGS